MCGFEAIPQCCVIPGDFEQESCAKIPDENRSDNEKLQFSKAECAEVLQARIAGYLLEYFDITFDSYCFVCNATLVDLAVHVFRFVHKIQSCIDDISVTVRAFRRSKCPFVGVCSTL